MSQPHEILTVSFPTWNNLRYLKLFYKALRQNSRDKNIELVLHINDGSDGTLEWVQEQGIRYTHSETNLGISIPMNRVQSLVNTEYSVLLSDDIYVVPDWDTNLTRMLDYFGHTDDLWVAPRLIEPVNCFSPQEHPYCTIANYGQDIDTFEEDRLLSEYKRYLSNSIKKLPNGNMAIKTSVYRELEGYDIEYIFGADSDFTYRFFQKYGSKGFKQLGNSLAYHFGSVISDSNREKKEQANQQSIQRFQEKHGFFVGDLTKVIVNSEK